MPRKKEVLEDQETEMLMTLAAPEEAAESPDLPADPPEACEEMPSEPPAEDSGEPVDTPPGQDAIQPEEAPVGEQPTPTEEESQDVPQAEEPDPSVFDAISSRL